MPKWKKKSAPEIFSRHSAESNVGSRQNALSVKIYKVDVRKIQNVKSNEKDWPSNKKNGIGIPKSHIDVINGQIVYSDKSETQWYYLYLSEYISFTEKRILCTKMVSSFSGKSTYHTYPYVIKMQTVSWQTVQKIVLCYLLFLEVYTHLFFGLHVDDDDEYWP